MVLYFDMWSNYMLKHTNSQIWKLDSIDVFCEGKDSFFAAILAI